MKRLRVTHSQLPDPTFSLREALISAGFLLSLPIEYDENSFGVDYTQGESIWKRYNQEIGKPIHTEPLLEGCMPTKTQCPKCGFHGVKRIDVSPGEMEWEECQRKSCQFTWFADDSKAPDPDDAWGKFTAKYGEADGMTDAQIMAVLMEKLPCVTMQDVNAARVFSEYKL